MARNLIKISSSLFSDAFCSKPEEFSLNDIEVFVDKTEQNWFMRAHIGQYLGIAHIIALAAKLSEEDIRWDPLGKMLRIMIFSFC